MLFEDPIKKKIKTSKDVNYNGASVTISKLFACTQ